MYAPGPLPLHGACCQECARGALVIARTLMPVTLCPPCCVAACRPINDSTEPVEAQGPFEVIDADTIRECLRLLQGVAAGCITGQLH